ncbi:MAG: dockerin type I repeat-containing protein [Aeoliella sp.]
MMRICRRPLAFVFVLLAAFETSYAAPPVPAGLQPRDTYQLVFNSSLFTLGTPSNISYYNGGAQQAADLAGMGVSEGVEWKAIVSTALMDARENAVVGANTPVYNLNLDAGLEQVATGFADMWDGSLTATINYDENGNVWNLDAWTGSNLDGTKAVGFYLGSANAWCGHPFYTEFGDAEDWIHFLTPPTASTQLSVFALSEELTVPVPASTMAGDYNADGVVDAADCTVWRDTLGSTSDWRADGNNDGVITAADYTHWKGRYGDGVTGNLTLATSISVPEPPTSLMILFGCVVGAVGWARAGEGSRKGHLARVTTVGKSVDSRAFPV